MYACICFRAMRRDGSGRMNECTVMTRKCTLLMLVRWHLLLSLHAYNAQSVVCVVCISVKPVVWGCSCAQRTAWKGKDGLRSVVLLPGHR